MNFRRLLASALLLTLLSAGVRTEAYAQTVPSTLSYGGRLLNSSGQAVTHAVTVRFSLWKSGDWTSSDTNGDGTLNLSAVTYGGWSETQTVTPNSNGNFQLQVGSTVALPVMDFVKHKFLQVEVKRSTDPETSYVLLDPTGDSGADTNDRKTMTAVAYAKNSENVANRTVGTSSGNILILGPGGKVKAAQMGSGTNALNFSINAGNTSGDATLTFGNALLPATIKYAQSAGRFEFSDDVLLNGSLRIASGGTLSASGAIATEAGLTINKDNAAQDAVITFGNSLGAKTLKFSTSNQRFEFNDDVRIAGDLTVTGTVNGIDLSASFSPLKAASGAGLTVSVSSGSYRLGSTITQFSGSASVVVQPSTVNYLFFGSGGLTARTMSFPTDESFIPVATVTTGSAGVTSIADKRVLQTDTREHEDLAVLTPEFDKAAYQGDGAGNVGTLSIDQDSTSKRNFYQWTSTKASLQDYDIFVRVLVPQDFVRWKTGTLVLHYRSTTASAADNALDLSVYDTNGSAVTLSGTATNLASTSWATTTINFSGNPVWTPGSEFLLRFHVSAKNGNQIHIGSLELRSVLLQGQ